MKENNQNQKGPIGFFDSGFGGLSILKEVLKGLPSYSYIYLGDNARVPYGPRSQEKVFEFTVQAVNFLFSKNCPLVILACNTASSKALRRIQQEVLPANPKRRVLGVLIPAAEKASQVTSNKKVGVVATRGTVLSNSFKREIKKLDPEIKVFQNPAPLLVPLIENGEENSPATQYFIKKYISPLVEKNIDTLILGCTHYGIIKEKIKDFVGEDIDIIEEGAVVKEKLAGYLKRHDKIDKKLEIQGERLFFTTDINEKFERLGEKFLEKPFNCQRVNLENHKSGTRPYFV